jgi:2-polyprenyl-3-methyl-5-hydroxy-6-metoxy-1,4-benzoquinol methylase
MTETANKNTPDSFGFPARITRALTRRLTRWFLGYDPTLLEQRLQKLESAASTWKRNEDRLRALQSKFDTMEKLLAELDTNPNAAWLYANSSERMDATVPFFNEISRAFHLARYAFACDYVKGKTVADIACGTGYGTAMLVTQGGASGATGCDINPETIRYATDTYGDEKISFLCDTGDDTGLPENSVEVITSFETIEHVPDDRALLREFARVLRPGGTLICSTPNQWPLEDAPHHVREYTLDSFRMALEESFAITAVYNQNSGAANRKFNRGQPEGIVPTTPENQESAECYIAVCTRK